MICNSIHDQCSDPNYDAWPELNYPSYFTPGSPADMVATVPRFGILLCVLALACNTLRRDYPQRDPVVGARATYMSVFEFALCVG